MATTKAQQRAVNKYVKANYDRIEVKAPKGTKELLTAAAAEQGESLNQYIKTAVAARYEAETGEKIKL